MEPRTKVGIVVPTLGTRDKYLKECLESLEREKVFVTLIGPKRKLGSLSLSGVKRVIDDEGLTLPEAINYAISKLPAHIQYVSWLGDDDAIVWGGIVAQVEILEQNPGVVATYGQCLYVDADGQSLMMQKSGAFAAQLVSWGPNLIPQPGGLFRRSAWERVRGLKSDFSQSFDTDLFLRLKKIGQLRYLNKCLSRYRWHQSALSVDSRWISVRESSIARRSNASSMLIANPLLELMVQGATMLAGKLLTIRMKNVRKRL